MTHYTKPKGSLISFMSNKVKEKGGINLAQGIPGFPPPKELLDELNALTHTSIHQYAPGNGNKDLVDELLDKYQKEQTLNADNLLITQGGTEALTLLFIYLKKKRTAPFSALAFSPVYESYRNLPEIFNTPFIEFSLPVSGAVNFQELAQTIQNENVGVIFLATPGNPLGRIWSKTEMKALIELCEQNKVYLILDAVYRELYFDTPPYLCDNYTHPQLFYTNSFSKLFSITGWRIGYIIGHQQHLAQIKAIHDYTGLCAPSIQQQALANYLQKHQQGTAYIQWLRENLTQSFTQLKEVLEAFNFTIPEVKGGYFIWAKLPSPHTNGFDFAMQLYDKERVAVIPGEHFSPQTANYIRLNIAHPLPTIDKAAKHLAHFLKV
jgi:aspartate/methionine/tyrosine aminotransferase